jgi:predicted nucleic acid-binding Zn ribbon protein
MHCIVCQNPIPHDRPKLAVTCSKECTVIRKNFWRSRQDARTCRYCLKPSTPEQRLAFQRWKRQPQNPEEEERFRLWRQSESNALRVTNRQENKRKRKAADEEPEEHEAE